MDKYRVQLSWKKVREFLYSSTSREFFVFLFFVLVSSVFWLLQTLDETFETELVVPLELKDVPDDVVITSPLPNQLMVSVREKGTTLFRYWRHDIPPVVVSFYDYAGSSANGRVRLSQSDIQKAVQERLYATTKIQSIRPDTLEYYYNHGKNVMVPVVVSGEIVTDSRYYLLNVQTEPSEVKVFASAATLDTLKSVSTIPVNLTNLKESTTVQVALRPVRGAKIEPAKVKVTANVDVYMENTVEIPIESHNFPGDKQLRTFPSTVQVTYTVGYARSKEITRKNFVFLVSYEEILKLQESGASRIPVQLKTIPDGVTNVRVEPREVDYLLESVSGVE